MEALPEGLRQLPPAVRCSHGVERRRSVDAHSPSDGRRLWALRQHDAPQHAAFRPGVPRFDADRLRLCGEYGMAFAWWQTLARVEAKTGWIRIPSGENVEERGRRQVALAKLALLIKDVAACGAEAGALADLPAPSLAADSQP